MASWSDLSVHPRPDSIPDSADPFIAPKRREAQAHWRGMARRLPRRAQVLEVGAGSCLASRWMAAARPDLTLIASDCGDYPVDPGTLGEIAFVPRTAIEQLPFADAAFDAVISQFGFEYARREPALGECARVLRRGGRLSFLMHARSGALQEACRLRVAAGKMLLEEPSVVDLLAKAGRIAEPSLRAGMDKLVLAPRLADRLQRLAQMEAAAGIALPSIRGFLEGASRRVQHPGFSAWLAPAREALENSLFVAEDQLRSALDRDAIDALSDLARSLGLEPGKAHESAIAWAWSARRA